jgi:hypothetical protein
MGRNFILGFADRAGKIGVAVDIQFRRVTSGKLAGKQSGMFLSRELPWLLRQPI